MNLEEVKRRFEIPEAEIKKYIENGYLRKQPDSDNELMDEDFEFLGLIETLKRAGFSEAEINSYLELARKPDTYEERSYMLRKKRRMLLDNIHSKQKILDQLDYLLTEK